MLVRQQITQMEMYKLTEDAYTGGGGFGDGGYLFSYGREMDFPQRQKMSYYTNYIAPIIDAQTEPVFVTEPQREYNDNPIIDGFINNADNNGSSLTSIIKHSTTYTNLLGNSFIVMDNFSQDEIPENLQAVIDDRKYPYIYSKECVDVYEYETDIFGKLLQITFFYGMYKPSDYEEEVYLYKRFTAEEIEYFWIEKVKNDDGKVVDTHRTVSLTSHTLGVVPVVYYNPDILPVPPKFYSMASLARAIYNTASEIQDLQRSQSFSILLIPSTHTSGEPDDTIVVSNHNALFYDSDATHAPSYISPDSNIMKTNQDTMDKQINLLIQQADVLGSTAMANGNGNQSGIAYSYRFFGKQQKLRESSNIATYLETKLIELLGKFMGVEYEYSVTYPDSFAPTFAENKDKLVALEGVANMNISDTVTSMVYGDITSIVGEIMQWDDEQLNDALESITEVQEIV